MYGAHLTAAEKKAMDIEIRRQLAEYDLKHANELDAMILWHLHEEFGFGPKRLKQFYDTFAVRLDELIKHYEMTDSDMVWLCTYKLKQYGIDIEEWNKQRRDCWVSLIVKTILERIRRDILTQRLSRLCGTSIRKTKDFTDCCIHCFISVSLLISKSKAALC